MCIQTIDGHFAYFSVVERLLLSFSAFTNGNKVLTVGPSTESNLSAIHGIRFLSMSWVILGHTYAFITNFIGTHFILLSLVISANYCNRL